MTAKTQKRASLTDYAATHKPRTGISCWLCGIPERAEVEAAADNGVPNVTIFRWLRDECGYAEATDARVGNHVRNHPRLNGKAAR